MSGIYEKRKKSEIGEFRRWEDMEYDCLVNILERSDMESLLLDIPLVCKSWHKASLSPSCWKRIDCSEFYYSSRNKITKYSLSELIRLIVSRGQGKFTSLVVEEIFSTEDLKYVAAKCPKLKTLSLDRKDRCSFISIRRDPCSFISTLIPNWKNLEELRVRVCFEGGFREIVAEIGKNCKNFSSLEVSGGRIETEDALAVANYLPKLKKLTFPYCEMENLEIIVLGCKELEHLVVNALCGCECEDYRPELEKLKKVTSHIKTADITHYRQICFHDYSDMSSYDNSYYYHDYDI